jgi:HPr kinase/phosphorylase
MEIRGIGILHVPSIFGVTAVRAEKQLDLLVTFRRMEDVSGELDRVGDEWRTIEILGVPVPEIVIPVSVGRDLVNLVEIAAQQFKLRSAGYDPVAALDEQLKRRALS